MSYKTYLGQKGYSIYKDSISLKEQVALRENLMAKPCIPKSPVQIDPYPIYLESAKKLYLPREYGYSIYGEPQEIRIAVPVSINLEFKGILREDNERNQVKVVEKYITHIKNHFGGLLDIYCGFGKTVLALKIISLIKLKTLIIVHKEFLLNQWVERINEFLPDAKIGRIQGPIIDIENKDIVIGMLQSLSMKEYPDDQFCSFGLLIVDEVHHSPAETFVRALQKIVTKHTLGLSATMKRKDGLHKVFELFLGPIIHKEYRKDDNKVLVKAINYIVDDDEFNEIEYDYRGNPKYTTMISKICTFNPRNEFILKVITNELSINNNQQILILAHQKNILTYLFKAIEYRNIASVGYYIGGMKEKDLKISETKTIILATYSMAAEALDIKTLTSLVLATPKTDIEQAVGRILRVKHFQPLIIDIIDNHELFKNQWTKRKRFYHSNNYNILISNNYDNNWEEVKKRCVKKNKQETKLNCLISINNLHI
tara:strand:+ start:657 stop:2108 length:1452 start_codon:yes stop_codon:yes gene_type:complete